MILFFDHPSKKPPADYPVFEDEEEECDILDDESFAYSFIDCNEVPKEAPDYIKHPGGFHGLNVFNHTSLVKEYFPVYFIALFFTFNKSVQEGVISEISVSM